MPTTANTINYYIAADGTLRDGAQGAIAQTPRIYYGTEYSVTLTFPASTIAEGDQLQVAVNRSRTFFSSASATGDAPVAAVAKHEVTAAEADAQAVTLTLSTNTRAMIDQVNGIDHPVRGFFGVHLLRGQSFISLAVADAFMLSVESGPDAISPSLPVVDYPTREEAEALTERSKNAANRAEEAAAGIVPPLQLSAPPTTSTVGSVGQLATWHDPNAADQSKADHEYHLLYIVESAGGKEYIWREDVTENQGNVAGGYPVLDENGKVASAQLPPISNAPEPIIATTAPTTSTVGVIGQLYVDTATSKTYHCTAITNTGTESEPVWSYAWTDDINAKGGTFSLGAMLVIPAANRITKTAIQCGRIYAGAYGSINASPSIAVGTNLVVGEGHGYSALFGRNYVTKESLQFYHGKFGVSKVGARIVGGGTGAGSASKNIEELSWNGDLYIAGGHQQGITEIPAATSSYTLAEGVCAHSPTSVPTYTLPNVTDTTRTHYIELTVDFTNVQTYSFLDANGDALVPLFTPSIAAGDVYTFRMEYSNIKAAWLIYPQKQGAVADDFVMRGEVGAANGVAGLDANAKVPSDQLPKAGGTAAQRGVVYFNGNTHAGGINIGTTGEISTWPATQNNITARTSSQPIVPTNLNYAVTAALTDSNHITLNDAQKATAQSVFGVPAPLLGTTAPTTSTVGVLGQLYVNTATSKTYTCTAITNTGTESEPVWSYTWTDDINAKGGVMTSFPATITQQPVIGLYAGDYLSCNMRGSLGCGGSLSGFISSSLSAASTSRLRLQHSLAYGYGHYSSDNYLCDNMFLGGKFSKEISQNNQYAICIGGGSSTSDRRNIEELSWNGDLYIAGGHQQGITVIPAATTAYTLAEGVQHHMPEAASVYTLPAVTDATRTHECILTIKFSANVLTYEFQDSAGNTLVPLDTPTIADGTVVRFRFTYEPLLNNWVIEPKVLGTYQP